MELADLMKSLDGMVQEQGKGKGKGKGTLIWEQHPDGWAKTKPGVQKPNLIGEPQWNGKGSGERVWVPIAAYLRIEEQICGTCGASHRYTRGFWELQRSGKATRSIPVDSADQFQLWLAEPQTVPVCPSCLAIPGETPGTVDQILAALDRQAGERKQGRLL